MAEGERFGAEHERRPATIRRAWRKVTASMTERPDEGAGPGEKGGPSSPPATEATNGERDERMKQAVEAARRQAEERATAEIMALLKELNERDGKTIIMVTHDPGLAAKYAHRIITMLDGTVISEALAGRS